LRGMAKVRWATIEAHRDALQHFLKAIELDPSLACAYGMAAWCYVLRKARGWMTDHARESAEAARLARRATHLGGDDPVALCMGGYALAFISREFEAAEASIDRGLAINPNLAQGWRLSAWLRVWTGEPDLVLEHAARAVRLSPLNPNTFATYGAMAYAHFLTGHYDMATACAEKAMRDNPLYILAPCVLAASNALAGRTGPARIGVARALECNPDLRASNLKDLLAFRRPGDLARFAGGLCKAGIPD
jgi:tetratricopeptide (TPR) repeat protein